MSVLRTSHPYPTEAVYEKGSFDVLARAWPRSWQIQCLIYIVPHHIGIGAQCRDTVGPEAEVPHYNGDVHRVITRSTRQLARNSQRL